MYETALVDIAPSFASCFSVPHSRRCILMKGELAFGDVEAGHINLALT
jgi:hypothetical protein